MDRGEWMKAEERGGGIYTPVSCTSRRERKSGKKDGKKERERIEGKRSGKKVRESMAPWVRASYMQA
jgi:hypothetical protein